MVVNDIVILELKAVSDLRPEHEWQLVNYLKATGIEIGLLLNFGVSAQHKRKIFTKGYVKNDTVGSVSSAKSVPNKSTIKLRIIIHT